MLFVTRRACLFMIKQLCFCVNRMSKFVNEREMLQPARLTLFFRLLVIGPHVICLSLLTTTTTFL
jgi:hypothetical protein